MVQFSDYIVYVDESGDHGLDSIDQNYPIFSLAFCIFKKSIYTAKIAPALQDFKFKYWGHDSVILHEHDIRKNMSGDYALLNDPDTRRAFIHDLNSLINHSPFDVIAAVIKKQEHAATYPNPHNPYELAMLFCMERLLNWLCDRGEQGKSIHVIFESRGKKEDNILELEFRRICDNASHVRTITDFSRMQFTARFSDKRANASGLQLADLIARPVGLYALRPQQENRAFDIIKQKLVTHNNGDYNGKGLKIFPK